MPERKQDPKVVTQILGLFHLDKLCPQCNGPLERKNTIRCNACDLKLNLRIHLESIETGIMSIRYQSGLKKGVPVHEIKKATPKKKAKPKKKAPRKTRAKKPTK